MSVKKTEFFRNPPVVATLVCIIVVIFAVYMLNYTSLLSTTYDSTIQVVKQKIIEPPKVLNFADYDQRMLVLATASSTISLAEYNATSTATSTASTTSKIIKKDPLWPAKAVYPNYGAILPFKRIVAYYGNFLSSKMGVLGEYPEDEMVSRLQAEIKKWEAADPTTSVMPAVDYIAVTAQGSPGVDGKYRARMSDEQIDRALEVANKLGGIVILEIQAGLSTLNSEIPALDKYLRMPQVHLAIDPEFYMKGGNRPGTVIGTMDASDVNYAAQYLANLVRENNLPPKILIVHRFTSAMVTNADKIKPLPEVQVIMDMDGWGSPARKKNTYSQVVVAEPVQFTGFKLFYKNDLFAPSEGMMTPEEVMNLKPRPIFIQYQ